MVTEFLFQIEIHETVSGSCDFWVSWLQEKNIFSSTAISESEDGVVDSDVMAEKNKIRSMTSYNEADNSLIVKDFTKFYGNILAVNQICVGVNK